MPRVLLSTFSITDYSSCDSHKTCSNYLQGYKLKLWYIYIYIYICIYFCLALFLIPFLISMPDIHYTLKSILIWQDTMYSYVHICVPLSFLHTHTITYVHVNIQGTNLLHVANAISTHTHTHKYNGTHVYTCLHMHCKHTYS